MRLTIDGKTYVTSGPLNTFAQLGLARKLAPGLPALSAVIDHKNQSKDKSLLSVLMLSRLSDEDSEYVIQTCLSVVSRVDEASGKAAPLVAKGAGLMFADVNMGAMLEIAIAVIEENLGDFFRSALANLDQEAQAKTLSQ